MNIHSYSKPPLKFFEDCDRKSTVAFLLTMAIVLTMDAIVMLIYGIYEILKNFVIHMKFLGGEGELKLLKLLY